MVDHHCCGAHSHYHESSSTTTEDNQTSSASSSLEQISSNDIHKHFMTNDRDNINDESQMVTQLFDIAWSNQNALQIPSVDTTTDDYARKPFRIIRLLESLEKRLISFELLSDNEQIEEA